MAVQQQTSGILDPQKDFSDAHETNRIALPGRSTPLRPLDAPTYLKSHLAISLGEYDQVHGNGNKRRAEGTKGNLRMVEVFDPTTEVFLHHLQKVGSRYGWDRREEYQPENHAALDKMMAHQKTRLFEFLMEDKRMGFCLVTAIDQHSKKDEIIDRFKQQRRLPANSDAIEINKFGLYDEFTGKGYGEFFLSKTLKILLEREKHGIVYLDTRDTNHRGVIKFYARLGIDVFFQEELPNDQVDNTPPVYTRPDAAETTMLNGNHNEIITNDNTLK